jgi:predicted peroxiredoxin
VSRSEPGGGPPRAIPGPALWVLLLQRGAPDVLYEAAAMTAAAVSLGLDVTLVWFDAALQALVDGSLDGEDGTLEPGTAGGAGRLLDEARRAGRVRYLACSASMVAGRAGADAVRARVDDIVGWPTAIALIRAAERSFVW